MFKYKQVKSEDFVATGVDILRSRILGIVDTKGICTLGLSGGGTPRPIYKALGGDPTVPWEKVHVFLVDERCVPPSHKDSNARLVVDTLMAGGNIVAENVCFPQIVEDSDPDEVALDYASELRARNMIEPDILILGLGPDGHIASLFPSVDLKGMESPVLHTETERFAVKHRITLSLDVIVKSRKIVMFIKGEEKIGVFNQMTHSKPENVSRWPALATMKSGNTIVVAST